MADEVKNVATEETAAESKVSQKLSQEEYLKRQTERLERFKVEAVAMERGRMSALFSLALIGADYVDAAMCQNGADGFKPAFDELSNTLALICDESIGASRLLGIWGLYDLMSDQTSEEESAETVRRLTPSLCKPLCTLIQRDPESPGLAYGWKDSLNREGTTAADAGSMLVMEAADGSFKVTELTEAVQKALKPLAASVEELSESEKSSKRTRTAAKRVTTELVKAVADGANRDKLAEKLAESDDFPLREFIASVKPEKLAQLIPLTSVELFIKGIATDPQMSKEAKADTLKRIQRALRSAAEASKVTMQAANA